MGAEETAHMLFILPLVACSYNFVTVCLENSRQVLFENDEHEEVLKNMPIVRVTVGIRACYSQILCSMF